VPKPIRKPAKIAKRPKPSKPLPSVKPAKSAKSPAEPKPLPEEPPKSALSRPEMGQYRILLKSKRSELAGDVEQLEGEAFRKNRQDAAGDLSTMPIHMADLGTDNFEQDITLGLIETEEEEVREIDAALERIIKGTFGRCERCHKMIAKARLKVLPYARLCIECKKSQESE
jgi:RNA polymerase-binding transcription factor DksA